MITPPEFTSRQAINDFIMASKEVTGVAPVELSSASLEAATKWLAKRWDIYYTPAEQAALVAAFVARRLSK